MENLEDLKYPVGRFIAPAAYSKELLNGYIHIIESLPQQLKQETGSLTSEQLNTAYRPGGWTVIQVVNHCADSHMNALIRIKLALTEETPTINPYRQELWAELADGKMPIHFALQTLEGIHARWAAILTSLAPEQWERGFIHPEKGKELSIKEAAASYAWHCEHHLAHITRLKKRMNW